MGVRVVDVLSFDEVKGGSEERKWGQGWWWMGKKKKEGIEIGLCSQGKGWARKFANRSLFRVYQERSVITIIRTGSHELVLYVPI